MAAKRDPAQLLSQKLLAGWAMLGESCANPTSPCNVPLMENRKGDKRIVCVQCNSEFVRDGDEIRFKSQPSTGQVPSPAVPSAALTRPTAAPATTSPVPTASSSSSPAPSKAAAASLTPAPVTGQYLLEHIEEEPDDYEYAPPTEEQRLAIEARMRESQKHSAEIGQKLLLGWTMTADSCNKKDCYLPLMRNPKNQELLCVACGPLTNMRVPFVPSELVDNIIRAAPPPIPTPKQTPSPVFPPLNATPSPTPVSTPIKVHAATQTPPQQAVTASLPTLPTLALPSEAASKFIVPPAAKNEVESVSVSLLALQAQLRLVWAALLKEYTEWWPLREGLLNFLDELRHSLAQVAAQARRLVVTGCAPPGAFILQQVDGDVAYLASVLVMKQTEAATRLKGSNNWIEAMELTRFIGRCSHWVHEAHTLKLLT